jgi:hypothetical protein
MGGLHRVAVKADGTGGGRMRGRLLPAHVSEQEGYPVLPRTVVLPRRDVCLNGALGPQDMWEQISWAARAVEGEDSVDNGAQVHGPQVAAALGRWEQRRQAGPLVVCQVRRRGVTRWGSPGNHLRAHRKISRTAP